ncbi:MAG: ABC transporter permease [Gemmatimonadetes bacterium]|nr:ABC transporter permease [Gemmatimonadota bacterium]
MPRKRWSYEWFIALRYLRSKRQNRFVSLITYISVGGVLVGVAALVIVLSLFNGFESEVRERIIGERAHINVYSLLGDGSISEYDPLIDVILSLDEVVSAAPYVLEKAVCAPVPTTRNAAAGVIVHGLDITSGRLATNLEENIAFGDLDLTTAPDPANPDGRPLPGIVLGRGLADQLGIVVGERVALGNIQGFSLTSALTPYIRPYRVTGISETGFYEYDASSAYVSLDESQKLFKLGSDINGIAVRVADRDQAGRISEEIEVALNRYAEEIAESSVASSPSVAYFTVDWMQRHKGLFRWMTLEKWGSFAILNLIILVAAFNIASTLIMVVLEKTRDIGILKSMGATAASITRVFIIQGSVVGILGTLLGCVIGYVLCWTQRTFEFIALPPDIYLIDALPVRVDPLDFASVALGSMLICVMAAVYPARKAAGLVPVEAIRHE